MKLVRFGEMGKEKPGVLLEDGTRLDVSEFVLDYDEEFFGSGKLEALSVTLMERRAALHRVPSEVRAGAPIARPSKIVCVGLNFRDHATESGQAIPSEPVLFFKSTTSLVGPFDPVIIPRGATKLDWEVELAFVMGKKASYVDPKHALDCVAGYALHNDFSERSFQLEHGGQWVKGKSADTFAPLGPFLATRDELEDAGALDMRLSVNGETRQKSNTREMIFSVASLVSYISQFMTLLPGDVVSTGTPAGVGLGMKPPIYLKAGDVVELAIQGLGSSRQVVKAWGDA
jgi:2,4-didehydro-3-deoxy-L-rhamnonate hydrolase